MGDLALGDDPEPIHPAVAHADPVGAEGLGNDHGVGAPRELAGFGQPLNAGVSSGLLVHRPGNLEDAREVDARPPEHFGGEEGRRDASLHVAGAASPDRAVPHFPRKGIGGPVGARGDHVEVPVQVQPPAAGSQPTDDVPPGIRGRAGWTGRRRRIVEGHVETGGGEAVTEKGRALHVILAGRVYSRDPDQRAAKGGDLVAGGLRLFQDSCFEGGSHGMQRHGNRGYRPLRWLRVGGVDICLLIR